ncbi:hypothetical protein TRIHO_34080 [Tritonibacter horizontis]|uniref:Uncharacterized protein n=1 Tax=Tritonibacter horizontis TaxID=1768241 RepID=A0A132BV94_9RHOB|nr:hypothetical protein TRIHO_34080 [Tritonibacter horizontis]
MFPNYLPSVNKYGLVIGVPGLRSSVRMCVNMGDAFTVAVTDSATSVRATMHSGRQI